MPTGQRTLADLVVARGLVAAETLARARLVQSETGERIDSVLTRLGMVSEQAIAQMLAEETGLPIVEASAFPLDGAFGTLSPRFLRDVKAIPLGESDGYVGVAFADPLDTYPGEAISFVLQRPVAPAIGKAADIEAALDRLYGNLHADGEIADGVADESDIERLKDLASDAPVVRAVNGLITRAVEAHASDIHIEPTEDGLKVRFRVDGALKDQDPPPPSLRTSFVSRIKVMAGLDIAERRLPQDGRMRMAVRGQDIDLRVATSPTIHGETVVLRILDRSHLQLEFGALGFDDVVLAPYLKMLARPHGIILVTGPTGSGKTTTLYASLASLNTPDRKILTIEDPIEYRLKGINQTHVKPQIGLSFAAALRSFLRQDPDIIMVGEIRDLETAQVAIQAALTGHAILSTLHTNNAASAITRLLDMGVEPFLITSTLNGVLAQRLVRRLCPDCREEYVTTPDVIAAFGFARPANDIVLFRPKGCAACGGSGYLGRLAILEFLELYEDIIRLVLARAEWRDIQRAATAHSMRTMMEDGFVKAREGLTTVEEILRATREG